MITPNEAQAALTSIRAKVLEAHNRDIEDLIERLTIQYSKLRNESECINRENGWPTGSEWHKESLLKEAIDMLKLFTGTADGPPETIDGFETGNTVVPNFELNP